MPKPSEYAVTSRSEEPSSDSPAYEMGQRLYCAKCSSEIEITNPCTCLPPAQDFRCCGEPMRPNTGVQVNLNVEG